MKCEEFRRINYSEKTLLESTRAERASGVVHFKNCEECRKWLDDDSSAPPSTMSPLEAILLAELLSESDNLDPEFREIVSKGKQ